MEELNQTTSAHFVAFGRRKILACVCVVDAKQHLRQFLSDAVEEFGLLTADCAGADDIDERLERQPTDLVVLGFSAGGQEAARVLTRLAARSFAGQVLLWGPKDSSALAALRQLGEELDLALLPDLTTPFGTEALRNRLAPLLPVDGPPRAPVDVAEALKAGWLELWYQHKVDVHSLAPRGAEATLRMRHPSWGVVAPSSLLADERDPQSHALSSFVLQTAMDDWHFFLGRSGPLDLSINLPAAFLTNATGVEDLCRLLPAHPAFPGLTVEVDGADIAAHFEPLREVARRVRFHNVAVTVDNLGVDWPALMDLERFPFVEIKVDRNFVNGCADDRLKRNVCRSIAELAAGYGARAIAEGVDSRADLLTIRELGFDLAQGSLFGQPVQARKFARARFNRALPQ